MISVLADAKQLVDAHVGRLELALPSDEVGTLVERDGRVLLVHQAGAWALHRDVPNVEARRDIARNGIVAIHCDRPEQPVMMSRRLAFGNDDGPVADGPNDLT